MRENYAQLKSDPIFLEKRKTAARSEGSERRAIRNRIWYQTNGRKPEHRFKRAVNLAKKREILWEIPFEEYKVLAGLPCVYCGCQRPNGSVGLDRKENKEGYTSSNVVPCCAFCNRLKNNLLSHEEALDLIARLVELRRSKDIWETYVWGSKIQYTGPLDEVLQKRERRRQLQKVFIEAAMKGPNEDQKNNS
jgi:hypothetical protein